jgi:carbon-monoxide dehydrogenase large subunit
MNVSSSENLIGQCILRREDPPLLRGHGSFLDDIAEPAGTLHLAFLLSPHAHARIVRIDASAARAAEGVVAVFTGADFTEIKPLRADSEQADFQLVLRPAVAIDRVRFVGEAVAVVAAADRYLAEDALELIEVEYVELPALVDIDAAKAPGAQKVHDDTEHNVVYRATFKSEGFDAAFGSADLVVRDTYYSHRLAALPIEPRGCLALYDRGRDSLTFWSSTQLPHIVRTALAESLGWDETRLRVIAPDVGGGFGMKAYLYPEEMVAAYLARHLEAPIKWVCDRREDLLTSAHGRDYRFNVAMAFRRDGTLLAVDAKIDCNVGAYSGYPFGPATEAGGGAIFLPGPYRLQHYAYDTCAVVTNTCPTGVYRGVAAPAAFFATEGLMDRAAHALGFDPAELRLENILRPEEFPYVNVIGIRYDGGTYEKCLRTALDAIGYDEFRKRQPRDRLIEGKYRGIGIGCVVEHTGQGASRYRKRGILRIPGFEAALVKVEPTGKANVWVSQTTQGQGHLTTFAQIAAQELGLKVEDLTVIEGDTAQGPYGSGAFASRGAIIGGGAVMRAARQVGDKVKRLAAHLLEASPGDIELANGYAHVAGVPQLRVSMREIAAVAYSFGTHMPPAGETHGLEATDYYDPPVVSINNATHVCQVAVDAATGRIEIERYLVVHDCGRVINPLVVDGQIHGAVAQGISSALCEALRYDEQGQMMTGTLMDYLVATTADMPDIEVLHEETWSKDTVGGFKGVGEGGVVGALPAFANAVADALLAFDARVTRLPLLPGTVLRIIETSAARKG